MKRFASKVFSKLVIGALIIILQFGWFVYLIYSATATNSAVNMCLQIVAVALALYIANKDMRTSYKMSWIFLVLFLPIFGCPAYFIFGRSEITKRTRKRWNVWQIRWCHTDRKIQKYGKICKRTTFMRISNLIIYLPKRDIHCTGKGIVPIIPAERMFSRN